MKISKGLPQVQAVWRSFLGAKGYDAMIASSVKLKYPTR